MIDLIFLAAKGAMMGVSYAQREEAIARAKNAEEKLVAIEAAFAVVSKAGRQQAEIIEQLCKALDELQPHNLTPQIADIHEWMRLHMQSEEKTLREYASKQFIYNVCTASVAGVAFLIAILK